MNQVLQLFPLPETELAPEPVEISPGKHYGELWRRYLEVLNRYGNAINAIRADEKARHGGEDWSLAIEEVGSYDTNKLAKKTAGRIRDRLVWIAEDGFSPPGVKLRIKEEAIHEISPPDSYTDFDPEKIWAWLENAYGGDQGETTAWRQAASDIIEAFDLEHRPDLQMKSGYVVLNLRVWMESWRSVGKTLSYQSVDRVSKAFLALSGFARWDGRDHLAHDLYLHAGSFSAMDAVTSRAKTGFGEKDLEVLLVTFHTIFEVRMRPDVAERLQVFLSTYLDGETS